MTKSTKRGRPITIGKVVEPTSNESKYYADGVFRKKVDLWGQKFEQIKKTKTILEEAQSLVYGDRQESYGSVTDNFTKIAQLWSPILNTPITPEQVGLCMIAMKIARECHKPKRDNLTDIAGYAATIEKMQTEKLTK